MERDRSRHERRCETRLAVFVDSTPLPPGDNIVEFARKDDTCERIPTCPDQQWLAANQIYLTQDTSFVLTRIQERSDVPASRRPFHEITLVVLDENGTRRGEIASVVEFKLDPQP